ncbi:MAG: hypothetical protein ACTS73_07435 [Arsenophonus sp. NEOnobi-MAG3]
MLLIKPLMFCYQGFFSEVSCRDRKSEERSRKIAGIHDFLSISNTEMSIRTRNDGRRAKAIVHENNPFKGYLS